MAASAGAIRAGGAYYELVADPKKLKTGLDSAKSMVKSWGTSIASIGASFAVVGAGIGAVGSLIEGGLGALVEIFRRNAGEIRGLAGVTGMSVEQVQELSYAFVQLGSTAEDAQHGMVHMAHFLGELQRNPTGNGASLVADLNLDLERLIELGNRDPGAAFRQLGNAAASLGSSNEQMDRLREIFGRSGPELRGVMRRLGTEFGALSEEAHRNGLIMSNEDVAAGAALSRQYRLLGALTGNLANQFGAVLAPPMTRVLEIINDGAAAASRFIAQNRDWARVIDYVAIGLIGLGGAIVVFGGAITITGYIVGSFNAIITAMGFVASFVTGAVGFMGTAFGVLGTVLSFVGGVVSLAFAGLVALGGAVVAAATAAIGGAGAYGALTAFLGALGITLPIVAAGTGGLSLAELAATAATWLLNAAIAVAELLTGAWLIPLALAVIGLGAIAVVAIAAAAGLAVLSVAFLGLLAIGGVLTYLVARWIWSTGIIQESASAIGGWFAEAWSEVVQWLSAITNAIGAGNWSAAMSLAGATLNLGWVYAIEGLKLAWMQFSNWFIGASERMALAGAETIVGAANQMLNQLRSVLPAWAASALGLAQGAGNSALDALRTLHEERERGRNLENQGAEAEYARRVGGALENYLSARDAAASATRGEGHGGGASWEAEDLRPRVDMSRSTMSGSAVQTGLTSAVPIADNVQQRLVGVAEAMRNELMTENRLLSQILAAMLASGGVQ